MKKSVLIFLFLILNISYALANNVSVNSNRKTVGMNESFTVEFSTDENVSGQPDFSPLQKDFNILSTSKGSSTTIINREVIQKTTWNLELIPKSEGLLVIPSISFGKLTTRPTMIEVTNAPKDLRDSSLYLETEITPKNTKYEQSQLIYTVRLYRAVNVAQGTLSDIKVNDPDAIIEKLGKDIEFEYHHNNGNRYVVLERKYAVYPQHSGELIFSPIVFEGRVMVGGHSYFNVQTEYRRVSSDEEKVEIKPIPAPFNRNNWLAAYDVQLAEDWSADPAQMKMGEPVTWTLTLTADGALGSQLPAIPLNIPNEIKQYQDKPQIENKIKGDGNVGVRQMKVALIGSKGGVFKLPEVSVKWWDLNHDEVREIKLPARTLEVAGEEVAMNTPIKTEPQEVVVTQSQALPLWAWALIGMNGIWIIGLGIYFFRKMNFKFVKPDFSVGVRYHLKQACKNNDAKQAEAYLLSWARTAFPAVKFHSIMEIRQYVSVEMQKAIEDLYQALYGHKSHWEGDWLWQAFASFKVAKPSNSSHEPGDKHLKKLY